LTYIDVAAVLLSPTGLQSGHVTTRMSILTTANDQLMVMPRPLGRGIKQ